MLGVLGEAARPLRTRLHAVWQHTHSADSSRVEAQPAVEAKHSQRAVLKPNCKQLATPEIRRNGPASPCQAIRGLQVL